jgi:hypothetical protein
LRLEAGGGRLEAIGGTPNSAVSSLSPKA